MKLEQEITEILNKNLKIKHLELIDDSHQHVGHAGSAGGARHFTLNISAEDFAGKTPVARHQMIYSLLGHLIPDKIHALRINAK